MKTTLDYEKELIENFTSYGASINFIEKKPKINSFIFNADEKTLCLKKIYVKENIIASNFEIQKALPKNEMFIVENIEKTTDDRFYISVNDTNYVAFNHIYSESLDLCLKEDLSLFFKSLLPLEKYFQAINLNVDVLQNFTEGKKVDLDVKKSNNHLKQIFKNTQNQKKKTDFDLNFINTYNKISKDLKIIEDSLLNNDIYKNRELGIIFNSTYLEKKDGVVVLKTPTTFAYGSKFIDIYNFICKYLKKCELTNLVSFEEIISLYDESIDKNKKEVIKFLLQYPFKYVNIMIQYYDKKRNFVPTEILVELEEYALFKTKVEKFLDI